MEDKKVDWVQKAIEREALPRNLREETVEQFAFKYGIDPSTYYYNMRKKTNRQKVVDLSFVLAKEWAPDVLEILKEKIEKGSEKSIEMYMDYVLELKKKLALVGGNKNDIPITIIQTKYDRSSNSLPISTKDISTTISSSDSGPEV